MSRLDDELRKALRRQDPGPDFTARVLSRAAAAPPKVSRWHALAAIFRPPMLRWAAAGVLSVLLITGGLEYRREQRQEARRGEAAKQQLVLALRIASGKLRVAQAKVMHSEE